MNNSPSAGTGVANTSSSRVFTCNTSQSPLAVTTETVPSWLTSHTFPSAPIGDAKYLSMAPLRRPCLITSPVAGLNEIRMPLSFTM